MSNVTPSNMRLYAITDTRWCKGESLVTKVEQALSGGATFLQLRDKEATTEELVKMALKLKPIARKYNIPFVIDDNVEAAIKSDIDGVHIGQSDMDCKQARKLLGPDKIIGMTAKTVEQAINAQKLGADYLGCGAMFPTTTKVKTVPMSKEMLINIAQAVDIPIVAIGGINSDNADYVKDTGVAGIAVVSAIFGTYDTYKSTCDLRKKADSLFR